MPPKRPFERVEHLSVLAHFVMLCLFLSLCEHLLFVLLVWFVMLCLSYCMINLPNANFHQRNILLPSAPVFVLPACALWHPWNAGKGAWHATLA
jgi:hypothetical protein